MDEETKRIKDHYAENFDPEDYCRIIVDREGGKFKKEHQFFLTSMAEIFSNPELQGSTLLDIGSGPTVHNIAPACQKYSHIVLSDFVDRNLEELKKWLKQDKDALNWTPFLQDVAAAQGYKDPEAGRIEIETLIRKNVKAVIHCDVLAQKIVSDEYNVPYDLVLTSWVLEAACKDYATFKNCLRKINSLIKPQGHLVMKGFLNGTPWVTGGQTFPYLKVSRTDIDEALSGAGFGKVEWKMLPRDDQNYSYEFESCYCLCCVKIADVEI